MEKYSRNLDRAILTKKAVNHYITKNLTYDHYNINMLDGTLAPKSEFNRT